MDDTVSKLEGVYRFHGHKSPGATIGAIMCTYALELYDSRIWPDRKDMAAVVESSKCIADAVQIIAHCTAGGGMKVIDYGKYAITLFNRTNGKGVRVFLDAEKLKSCANIHNWFFRKKSKEDLPADVVINEVIASGRSILSHNLVHVDLQTVEELPKNFPIRVCDKCGEAFPSKDEGVCRGCTEGYYEKL